MNNIQFFPTYRVISVGIIAGDFVYNHFDFINIDIEFVRFYFMPSQSVIFIIMIVSDLK